MTSSDCKSSAAGLFFIVSLFILACGIGFAGLKIHDGLTQFRSYDNYVTVKGLAMRDVEADLAVWPIAHVVTGDDLAVVQGVLEERTKDVMAFLNDVGIDDSDIEKQQISVVDLLAQSYRQNNASQNRFIVTQTVIVRSEDIAAISAAAENIGDLIKKGVVLANQNSNNTGPTYLFTKLNDVKPAMIAQATKNARDAADQFANDSGQTVTGIRRAYQGMFQILPRDQTYTIPESAQKYKTVRVVSTIDFYLE